jgi:selenocysteine lyase/cysteine desulfurase
MQHISDTVPGVKITSVDINTPTTHAEIYESFKTHIESLKSSNSEGTKTVLVLDALASNPGLLLPWERIVELCHKEGVLSVVDAAHAIGQQLDIDLSKTKPDFWISVSPSSSPHSHTNTTQNCHKWLYAKRGCAVLYVPKRNQKIIRTSFPTSFSYVGPTDWNADTAPNLVEQFEWNGTIDTTPYLSIDAALDFRQWLGGEAKINNYTRSLAIEAGKRVSEILGTPLMDQTENMELTLNMVCGFSTTCALVIDEGCSSM